MTQREALLEEVSCAAPEVAVTGVGRTYRDILAMRLRDYYTLTKPEVNLLILMTTSAGYYLADRQGFHLLGMMWTLVGTLLVASGTATLNQVMEWRYDAQMRRTAKRPLPSGRVGFGEALILGIAMSVLGTLELLFLVNTLSAVLALSTLLSYLLLYTPLKRKTALCTFIGAFPGAMPILIGAAGATGRLGELAWFLYAIVFLWQFPHFLAIALMYREDYSGAGYHMLPGFDTDGRFTRGEIVVLSFGLVAFTFFPLLHGTGNLVYALGAVLTGGFMLTESIRLASSGLRTRASRVLHASIIYLPVLLLAMVVGKV